MCTLFWQLKFFCKFILEIVRTTTKLNSLKCRSLLILILRDSENNDLQDFRMFGFEVVRTFSKITFRKIFDYHKMRTFFSEHPFNLNSEINYYVLILLYNMLNPIF